VSDIKRYDMVDSGMGTAPKEWPAGYWVIYSDHAAEIARLEAENRRLREALTIAREIIRHEVEPPKSCGRCGQPDSNCDGGCVDAHRHAEIMQQINAALTPAPASSGEKGIVARTKKALAEAEQQIAKLDAADARTLALAAPASKAGKGGGE